LSRCLAEDRLDNGMLCGIKEKCQETLIGKRALERLKVSDMLNEERQRAILDLLRRDGRVLVVDLARQFHTSQVTIRKDLEILHVKGEIHRATVAHFQRATAPWKISLCEKKRSCITRRSCRLRRLRRE